MSGRLIASSSKSEEMSISGAPISLAVTENPLWFRCLEKLFALAALVLAMPLMLVEAVLIKLDTPGPSLIRSRPDDSQHENISVREISYALRRCKTAISWALCLPVQSTRAGDTQI